MSTGRTNALDALPRGSLLTYFRNPYSRPRLPRRSSRYHQRPSRPYSRYRQHPQSSRRPLLPRIAEKSEAEASGSDIDTDIDLEAQYKYWGVGSQAFDEEDGDKNHENAIGAERWNWKWLHVVGFVCYTFLLLVVVLKLDSSLSHTGIGTGMGEQETLEQGHEIQFCRSTTNREVPSSRVWRVMAPTSLDECNTEIVTLKVGATEEWKLWPDDEILLGDPGQLDEKMPTARKFIQSATDSDKDASDEELGDDRAEEGKLGLERHSGRGRYRRLTDC